MRGVYTACDITISTVKVWDYQTKSCIATLEGHSHNVSAVAYHPTLPLIVSAAEDGIVQCVY